MVTTLVDLTEDTSDDEVKHDNTNSTTSPSSYLKKRKIGHSYGKKAPSTATETPKTDNLISLQLSRRIEGASDGELRDILRKVIEAASGGELQDILRKVCRENIEVRGLVEGQLLSDEDKEKLRQLDEDEYASDRTTESLRESRERWKRKRLDALGGNDHHTKLMGEADELCKQFCTL